MRMVFLILFSISIAYAGDHISIPAPAGGDFRIAEIDTQKLRGKNIFLYFGFTRCPHICPLTLARLKQMTQLVPEAEKNDIQVIFISVDNVRDTTASLKKYIAPYGPQFLATTANDKVLNRILPKFGARYSHYLTPNKVLLVDHTSSVFVINKKGEWAGQLDFDASPAAFYKAYRDSDSEKREFKVPASLETLKIAGPILEKIKIRYVPQPKVQEDFKITVTSPELIPLEADITGIERSMGYIRPKFIREGDGSYSAKVNLPLCELKKMRWKLNIIFQAKELPLRSALFTFETKE